MPGAIEASEARGQRELVASTQLPVEMSREDRAKLEAAGVKLGKPLPDDGLFCNAELPKGWRLQPTDHSMWSKLIDAEGNERASIFYKAAFYDRRAFLRTS